MAQQNSDVEKHLTVEDALPPPKAAREGKCSPVSTSEKTGKRTIRFAGDESEKVSDSSRLTENEENSEAELKSSQEEQVCSRNVSYPLNGNGVGDSNPVSSDAVTWNVSSSPSTHGPSPVGNGPYSTNEVPGLYAPVTNFSQTYSTYQPSGPNLYDSPSLASPYSSMPGGRKHAMIPTSEYYTPEVATPTASQSSMRPDVRPSEPHIQHSSAFGGGKSPPQMPPISQQPLSYVQDQFVSSQAQKSSNQTTQSRPQQSALPEAVIPLYPSSASPKVSAACQSSSQSTLPSDTLYTMGAYTNDNDSFPQGLHGGNQVLSEQYESCDNPRPPGYPSGPNTPKSNLKPSKGEGLRPDAHLSSAQVSMDTPHSSLSGTGPYLPYKQSVLDGTPSGSRIQPSSEPVKYMSPAASMSKRPLAFVPQSTTSMGRPPSYVQPSIGDSVLTPLQPSGQDAGSSLPSYLPHQTPTYLYQQEGSKSYNFPAQRLSRVQVQDGDSHSFSVPPARLPSSYLSEQYISEGDFLASHMPSEPARLRPESISSRPMPAGRFQGPPLTSNGIGGSHNQEGKISSFDLRFNGRPLQEHSPQVTPQVGLRINSNQTPVIPRPSSNPTYSSGPPSHLQTRISQSSSYCPDSLSLPSIPSPAAFQDVVIPNHKISDVPQISPGARFERKQSYGQPPMYCGSQNNPYLSKYQGSQGQASLGQSTGEAFIPGYQTPKLRPQQQSPAPYVLQTPQSEVSANDQNPVPGQTIGLNSAVSGTATTYNSGEQEGSAQNIKNPTAPSNYSGPLPQRPIPYSGTHGFLPASSQPTSRPSFLAVNNQTPYGSVSPHLGPSNYGNSNDSTPNITAPGTPSMTHQAVQNPYGIGTPNVPLQQGSSHFALPHQYGRPSIPGTVSGAQHPYYNYGGQQVSPDQHVAHLQTSLHYPPGNQAQMGRLPYPSSGPGNYINPTSFPLGVPNVVPKPNNPFQSGVSPNNPTVPPLQQPFAGFNASQTPTTSGAGVPSQSSLGMDGRPQGPVGRPQSNEVYEHYLSVVNGMQTLGINNGRI